MRLDRELDETLKRLPVWDPPPDFVRRVAATARAAHADGLTVESWVRVWAGIAGQGLAAVALGAAVGVTAWAGLDSYLRLMTAAANLAIREPLALSWTCAALSLVTAAVFTRRALV